MTRGAPWPLLAVVAALVSWAEAMPCPAWCLGQHQQDPASPWQLLLLPPHGVIALVPSSVRLCPPQQSSTEPPVESTQVLQTEAATTMKPVLEGVGPTTTEKPIERQVKLLFVPRTFINTPDIPCGMGQLRDSAAMCREAWPSTNGEGN